MAYDEDLAARVRAIISLRENVTERKMFGGFGFIITGNMACGVAGDELMVRVDPADFDQALSEANVRQFEMSGKKMGGWLLVAPEGLESDEDLAGWVDAGADYATSLPPK